MVRWSFGRSAGVSCLSRAVLGAWPVRRSTWAASVNFDGSCGASEGGSGGVSSDAGTDGQADTHTHTHTDNQIQGHSNVVIWSSILWHKWESEIVVTCIGIVGEVIIPCRSRDPLAECATQGRQSV